MSLRNPFALVFLAGYSILSPPLYAEEINIYFKTTPPLQLLRPLADAATLSLLATGAEGRPIAQGWVTIRLVAPTAGRFFSTDFPLVEGSRLIEMRLPLARGKADWKYLFPIRGEYRLTVEVAAADGKKATQTFPFEIRENESKWFFLGLFILGLFILGVVAGRIFSGAFGRTLKVAGCLWFLTGSLFLSSPAAFGQQIGNKRYLARLEVEPASVGKPSRVSWRLDADGSEAAPRVALTLTLTHLEKKKTVFAVEKLAVPGEFIANFHFTDGAEYRVVAVAELSDRSSVRSEQLISVTGVEPPTQAMIPALVFFLTVIGSGLVAGRWSRRKAAPS